MSGKTKSAVSYQKLTDIAAQKLALAGVNPPTDTFDIEAVKAYHVQLDAERSKIAETLSSLVSVGVDPNSEQAHLLKVARKFHPECKTLKDYIASLQTSPLAV